PRPPCRPSRPSRPTCRRPSRPTCRRPSRPTCRPSRPSRPTCRRPSRPTCRPSRPSRPTCRRPSRKPQRSRRQASTRSERQRIGHRRPPVPLLVPLGTTTHKGGTMCQYTHITYPTKESATIASVAAIWAEIQRLADENPGFVYRPQRGGSAGCSYLPDPVNPEGCIVGAALSRLGVAQELLEAYEGSAAAGLIKAALGRDPLVSNRYELTL